MFPAQHLTDLVLQGSGDLVVGVGLRLTAYLADGRRWAESGAAARALAACFDFAGTERFRVYTTSRMTTWKVLPPDPRDLLGSHLASDGLLVPRVRPFFSFQMADRTELPQVEFRYVEIDPARSRRTGLIDLTLPVTADPALLFQFLMTLTDLGPLHAAIGGFGLRWVPAHEVSAFVQFHKWARRFLGLDVQRSEEISWRVPDGLPGSNWLTFVGDAIAQGRNVDPVTLETHPFGPGVLAVRCPTGVLLRAGDSPTVADRNELRFPRAYTQVAQALAPLFLDDLPPLPGTFRATDTTKAWFRRFIEPQEWA